jgi:predicted GH43/DUF377 family glycosyl hydrolase
MPTAHRIKIGKPLNTLRDRFPTDDATPIATPRDSEPGPGKQQTVDGSNNLSISTDKIVAAGGAAAWGDPGVTWSQDDYSAFTRGYSFEHTLRTTTYGNYAVGLTTSATPTVGNTKDCLYVVANSRWFYRDNLDISTAATEEVIGLHVDNIDYKLKQYVLKDGGTLWLVKGGHYNASRWNSLVYSASNTHTGIYPAITNFNAAFQFSNLTGRGEHPPPMRVAYYNGRLSASDATSYQIGRCVSHDGITMGRDARNPILTKGSGWEAHHIKDPWVLKDGNSYIMWYSGASQSTGQYKIGYASSLDGASWTKSVNNPVIDLGSAGSFDADGALFAVAYVDNSGAASAKFKMFYTGKNAAQDLQIGYAFSSDGISWTKGAANPVVVLGSAGENDDVAAISGALSQVGGTFYLFYEARPNSTFPVDAKCGLVTFTNFDGTYTKQASILANKELNTTLTANLSDGGNTASVGSTSAFAVGDPVWIHHAGGAVQGEHNTIASIVNSTTLDLRSPVSRTFTTTATGTISTSLRSLTPRFVIKEGNKWQMWGSTIHNGAAGQNRSTETTFYATSTSATPDGGWSFDLQMCPPIHLAMEGDLDAGWDALSAANPVFVINTDNQKRLLISS